MAEIVDDGAISSNEATNRSKTLRESTHDEVHIIGESEVVADTTTLATEDTDTVSLIHHYSGAILLFEFNDFGQIAKVTFHREDTIHDDEFHRVGFALLELAL